MSVDVLQEKIRKIKNPIVLQLDALMQTVPEHLKADKDACSAYYAFALSLLEGLREHVEAVRFGFASYAMLAPGGLQLLSELMHKAKSMDYYVLMDLPELNSHLAAQSVADSLDREECPFPCDGMILSAYAGSDIIRPFLELCKNGKSLFPIVRTANKSAAEIQDLLTGARLVHTAVADVINRYAESVPAKCGYCNIGALAAASSADSLRNLRGKYKRLFLLLDGCDYPNSNAKNCSFAFDALGHGAAVCAGMSVTGAWQDSDANADDYVRSAVSAVLQLKKNLNRYITVL